MTIKANFQGIKDLEKDLNKLEKKLLPKAVGQATVETVRTTAFETQRKLNSAIDQPTAFTKKAIGFFVGGVGSNQFSNTKNKPQRESQAIQRAVTAIAERERLVSTIQIQRNQAAYLEALLEGLIRSSITTFKDGKENKKFSPYTLVRKNIKGSKLAGDLKYNRAGNLVRLRKGALAKAKKKANQDPDLFHVPIGENFKIKRAKGKAFTVKPGIYEETDTGRLKMLVAFHKQQQYDQVNFDFERSATSIIDREFPKNLNRALDRCLREFRA